MPDDIPQLISLFFLFFIPFSSLFFFFSIFYTHFLQIFFKPERGMGISLKNYNNNKRTIYRCHSEVIFSFCFSVIRLSNFFFFLSFHFTFQWSEIPCFMLLMPEEKKLMISGHFRLSIYMYASRIMA